MIRLDKTIGFTIVELMFALTFIGFIMLFTVSATVQIMRVYSKGVALKEINQSARNILEDISRVARNSDGSAITFLPAQNRICFGSVSYVWNTQANTINKYDDNTPVTMARAGDSSNSLCTITNPGVPNDPQPHVTKSSSTAILSNNVWVQNINLVQSADKNLVTISVRLSTTGSNQPTDNDPALGMVCSGDINGRYCAVSTFSTSVEIRKGGQ
ncbi:MAG TPA: hypothetical protein VNX65_01955 [Patescibacteria group bacterium]|jgi:hypothetical protein|nr:hypothetical protein [Patescibacteria group bacterium]